ncbi:hypothetical protein PILCRDRAFT_755566 [Piloderma croceum F 1598]|uniref:Uncharacterized protein n=1 Tax=Piloderma croceum (strain F 1598) TaxID=765440 RepID=A0A0C3AC74_PILCF|nr:hypothetical protein PILCRDRAFT_755566 [Piloderma croceum F 1598]
MRFGYRHQLHGISGHLQLKIEFNSSRKTKQAPRLAYLFSAGETLAAFILHRPRSRP